MVQPAAAMATPATPQQHAEAGTREPIVLGRFRGLVAPDVDSDFEYGGFPLPDGSFWRYREPDATVVVEHDKLRVTAVPLTRAHDRVQVLDNAKNMYFSKARILVPERGEVAVELSMRARVIAGRDEDLYSGFVSLNLLDFNTGLAFDWFVANRRAATVYGRLRFPGVPPAGEENPERPRYFCLFNEPAAVQTQPGEWHRYRIAYDRAAATLRFAFDGAEVDAYHDVPVAMDQFLVALGIMTEKPLGEQGSVSLFGQGVIAEYTEVTITGAAGVAGSPG
jgi:Family of unknown function (DUF6081)